MNDRISFAAGLLAVATIASLALAGCKEESPKSPMERAESSEPIPIAVKNGVTLWRVKDWGRSEWVYFTTPSGEASWKVSCGKGCTRGVRVGEPPNEQ